MTDNKKSYYAIIPANIRYDKRLNANAKLLFGEITALSNERGYCWASNAYFADLYEVSTTSISSWIKRLKEFGYIKSEVIYKEGSKEILHRYISLITEGIQENLHTPIQENLQDNITVNNNTFNNTNNTEADENANLIEIENFEKFWILYDKNVKRTVCFKKWKKIKPDTYPIIFDHVERYVKSTPDKQYRKNPETYLNNCCWNDEILNKATIKNENSTIEDRLKEFIR